MLAAATTTQPLCLVAMLLALAGCGDDTGSVSVTALEAQLAGAQCRFTYEDQRCQRRGFRVADLLFSAEDECDLWAVKCLGTINSAQSTKALIGVLESKADVETCDGVLPVRSEAVTLLGLRADATAIAPLERLLASRPRMKLSSGAVGCAPRLEDDTVIARALEKLKQ